MGKTYERIDGRLRKFIEEQPLFFTATAPLSGDGTVNLSPKGLKGSFAVLDEHTVAYLDFAGSTAETIAHLRENGRITLMWCAFQGPPNIVRVHGRGEPVFRDDPRFREFLAHFMRHRPGLARTARDHRRARRTRAGQLWVRSAVHDVRRGPRAAWAALRAGGRRVTQRVLHEQGAHRHEPGRTARTAVAHASHLTRMHYV